jgi:outer membrane protein assembly factor BamB
VIWERTAHEGVPEVGRSPNNSYASETPATDGEHVAAYFGSHGLHVFDFAGNLRWQTDFGLVEAGWFFDASVTWGSASSPIIYRDLVIVQVDRQKESFIAAFDVETGERRWLARRDELPSWGTPGIYLGPDHAELVTNGIEQIRGYDPSTGELLWHLKTGNSHVSAPSPVSGLGLIIVANGHRPLKPVYAIRPGARGDISLAPEATANGAIAWSSKSAGPYYVTPLIYGERLYILTEQGVLAAYYLKTGEQIYRQRVGGGAVRFSASPVAADGKIYLTDENCDVYVVRDGIEFELLGKNPLGEPTCMATPAISEGRMLFRTRHHLVAVGERRAAASPTAAAATGDDQ